MKLNITQKMRYITLNDEVYEVPEWFYKNLLGKPSKRLFTGSKYWAKKHQARCDSIRKKYKPTIQLSLMLRDD